MDNYALSLVSAAQRSHATTIRFIDQDVLIQHARAGGGMTGQLALADRDGICAALTVKFVEAAILGRLSQFSQNSLAQTLPENVRSQFGGNLLSLLSGGTRGNFEISAAHLSPVVTRVAPADGVGFMVAMRDAILRAATALGNTIAIQMHGDGGHVIGVKVVPHGTSSFFDANAGLYQVPSVDDLRALWRAAYEAAGYGFTRFEVVEFTRTPPLD